MNKKQLVNQLNNQNGITGADIVIAMLIILTTIGVIGTVYANLVIGSKETYRKTGATRIATNILENIDMLYYDKIESELKDFLDENNTYFISGGKKVFNTSIPKGYEVEINFETPFKEYTTGLKKITIKVKYKVDGQEKNVTLNKVIEREIVRECNSPNFTEEYIEPIAGTNFDIYNINSSSVQICPIQYDKETKKYKIVEKTDEIWYSYSNKQWARILVLNANELNNYIDSTTKTVKDVSVLKSDKSYVWIPRFGVKNESTDLFGNVYFKYKNTDNAILSFEEEGCIYNYFNDSIEWSTERNNYFKDGDKNLLGKWSQYSNLATADTEAYSLNQSQYGPMIEY